MNKTCYICEKPIEKRKDIWVMYRLDKPDPESTSTKIFSHKYTCDRKTWKLVVHFSRLKAKEKRLDNKKLNKELNRKINKKCKYKRTKFCGCGTCERS